jgi:hypothetical protein
MTALRDITFCAAGPQVNAIVRPEGGAMKTVPIALLASVVLSLNAAHAQDDSRPQKHPEARSEFLQPGKWWNLYSDERNDPLRRSIRAVKVVKLSDTHPSWVQIAFPKTTKEHFSIFGPAAKAHDDDKVDLDAALADWEKSITEWKVIWINLDFVVHMSPVAPDDARERPVAAE